MRDQDFFNFFPNDFETAASYEAIFASMRRDDEPRGVSELNDRDFAMN